MDKQKIWVSWSSGKDCAYALHELKLSNHYEVTGLLTALRPASRNVLMHGVPEELVKRQAIDLGLPLHCVEATDGYEEAMHSLLHSARQQCVSHIAFGDLFLEDIRLFRQEKMKDTGIGLLFPLWQKPTDALAVNMIESGFKAVITSVDLRKLPISYLGRAYDQALLDSLPPDVDRCGENGEFHTFVCDGPIFQRPIEVELGEISIEGDHGHIQLHAVR